MSNKITQELIKDGLHIRNKHRGEYRFQELVAACPELKTHLIINTHGNETIDFFNPESVKLLNQAILRLHYQVEWDLPKGFLCPPVPGRADYIHYVADLLASEFRNKIPKGTKVNCLDIGVGANCIYPLLGVKEYNWSFIGSEIDALSLASAQHILDQNPSLLHKINLRKQSNSDHIFKGIVQENEIFDCTFCNPPFYPSAEEASQASERKLNNIDPDQSKRKGLNFGGQSNELWCEGGELEFIQKMIIESVQYSKDCLWFTSLVSKESNLPKLIQTLEEKNAFDIKTIPMSQGNKKSRMLCWTFLTGKQRKKWAQIRWK